jgi:hypothetical protein
MNRFDKSVDSSRRIPGYISVSRQNSAVDHVESPVNPTQDSGFDSGLCGVNLLQKPIHRDPLKNQFIFWNFKVDSAARAYELPWLGIASSGGVCRPTGKR